MKAPYSTSRVLTDGSVANGSEPGMASDHGPKPVTVWMKVSTAYLFLPLVLFFATWLKVWIAIPLLGVVFLSAFTFFRSGGTPAEPASGCVKCRIAFLVIFTLSFAILTGMVDWVPQSTDYTKHNLILGDLVERDWPVRYGTDDGARYLCYGLGYYLPPAGFAKVFGISTFGIAGFVWGTLGLLLFFHWLFRQFKDRPWLGIAATLLCTGLGAFWHIIKSGALISLFTDAPTALAATERIHELGLYTSNLDSFARFFYQPQHGVVAWLGSALIYEMVMIRNRRTEAAAVLAATLFWSPLTALGLGMIGLAAIVRHPRGISLRPAVHCLTAALIIVALGAYYLPHLPILEKGFIWGIGDGSPWWLWYLLFCLAFVWIPVSALVWLEIKDPYLGSLRPVVVAMTILLTLTPLYKMGELGDLRMQVSGPAFLFIALAMAKGLARNPRLSPAYVYLAAVSLAGAALPLLRPIENLVRNPRTDYSMAALRAGNLNDILDLTMPGFDPEHQYLGDSGATLARILLKSPPSNGDTRSQGDPGKGK